MKKRMETAKERKIRREKRWHQQNKEMKIEFNKRMKTLRDRTQELADAFNAQLDISSADASWGINGTLGHIIQEMERVQFSIESMGRNIGIPATRFFAESTMDENGDPKSEK